MFLHVGNGKNIRTNRIIGIFDMDNATVSPTTRQFLREQERRGCVESAVSEIPKSFVVYDGHWGEPLVCLAQISSGSLKGRKL